jgi:hypothetical protein
MNDPRDPDNRPRLLHGPDKFADVNCADPELTQTFVSEIASIHNPATRSILYAGVAIAWCCAVVAILSTPAAVVAAWRILL